MSVLPLDAICLYCLESAFVQTKNDMRCILAHGAFLSKASYKLYGDKLISFNTFIFLHFHLIDNEFLGGENFPALYEKSNGKVRLKSNVYGRALVSRKY